MYVIVYIFSSRVTWTFVLVIRIQLKISMQTFQFSFRKRKKAVNNAQTREVSRLLDQRRNVEIVDKISRILSFLLRHASGFDLRILLVLIDDLRVIHCWRRIFADLQICCRLAFFCLVLYSSLAFHRHTRLFHIDLKGSDRLTERAFCFYARTLGILMTRCPVVFDLSALDCEVFTSSGNASWRTWWLEECDSQQSLLESLTFPLMVNRMYVGCTSMSTRDVSRWRKTATSRRMYRSSSLSVIVKSTLVDGDDCNDDQKSVEMKQRQPTSVHCSLVDDRRRRCTVGQVWAHSSSLNRENYVRGKPEFTDSLDSRSRFFFIVSCASTRDSGVYSDGRSEELSSKCRSTVINVDLPTSHRLRVRVWCGRIHSLDFSEERQDEIAMINTSYSFVNVLPV